MIFAFNFKPFKGEQMSLHDPELHLYLTILAIKKNLNNFLYEAALAYSLKYILTVLRFNDRKVIFETIVSSSRLIVVKVLGDRFRSFQLSINICCKLL